MIFKNISLRKYNTFGLDYRADQLISFRTEEELVSVLKKTEVLKYPLYVVGSGSNLLFTSNYKGTILHPKIEGISIEDRQPGSVIVSAGAGIIWDKFVEWSVINGFGGIENLSLIPGTVGASVVQNIGAYGIEVKDVVKKVRTVSLKDGMIKEFSKDDCLFDYRSSIFKEKIKGEFLVTRVYYKLSTEPVFMLNYGSLRSELKEPEEASLVSIREAVINIRRRKLPDPEIIGNAGSFFKNPVVTRSEAANLKTRYPKLPVYEDPQGTFKLAAGWLIEECGWRGKRIRDAGVYDKQALVLVNYGKATGTEIFDLSEDIKMSVFKKFSIELEPEIEVL